MADASPEGADGEGGERHIPEQGNRRKRTGPEGLILRWHIILLSAETILFLAELARVTG